MGSRNFGVFLFYSLKISVDLKEIPSSQQTTRKSTTAVATSGRFPMPLRVLSSAELAPLFQLHYSTLISPFHLMSVFKINLTFFSLGGRGTKIHICRSEKGREFLFSPTFGLSLDMVGLGWRVTKPILPNPTYTPHQVVGDYPLPHRRGTVARNCADSPLQWEWFSEDPPPLSSRPYSAASAEAGAPPR